MKQEERKDQLRKKFHKIYLDFCEDNSKSNLYDIVVDFCFSEIEEREKASRRLMEQALLVCQKNRFNDIEKLKAKLSALEELLKAADEDKNKLIEELWGLWENLAECGQISITKNFNPNYKRLKQQVYGIRGISRK